MLVSRVTFADRSISLFTHCTQFDLGMVYDEAGKRFMREPSQLDTVVDSLAFHTPSSSWCRPEQIFPVCFSVDSHAAAIIHNRNIIVILEGQEASCVS